MGGTDRNDGAGTERTETHDTRTDGGSVGSEAAATAKGIYQHVKQSEAATTADEDAGADADRSTETDTDHGSASEELVREGLRTPDEQISLDDVFDVIRNQRRRRVLRYLGEQESPVSMGTIADHVAALENDKSAALLTAQERKRVYVGLYQCHLPKMDKLDVIEFNKDRGLIEPGPQAPYLEKYLEGPYEQSHRWSLCYLGVSAAGIVTVGTLSLLNLLTGALVAIQAAFLVTLCLVAIAQTFYRIDGVPWSLPAIGSQQQSD